MRTITESKEHFNKYEQLAQQIGIDKVKRIVPAGQGEIERALNNGDEHLNTIPLKRWDYAVGRIPTPFEDDVRLNFVAPFTREVARGLSLAERVCILKHVAKYHIAS